MSAPVDQALALRLRRAETTWLAQSAARLRQARASRAPEMPLPEQRVTGAER